MTVLSLDGHDKLYGYANWTFPIGIYGCMDTFSRKMLFLAVMPSNSNPNVIGNLYLSFLTETSMIPTHIRVDHDTETGKMATIQAYLASKVNLFDNPLDSDIYGKSTMKKIERFWRDLHEQMGKYFKAQLVELLCHRKFIERDDTHRQILVYVYIPIIQRECNIFLQYWNSHRIRAQRDTGLPAGILNVLFACPKQEG